MDDNAGQDQDFSVGGKDNTAAQPVEAAPDSAAPAQPASEEAQAASGQPDPADDNPETDTDGVADEGEGEAIENRDPEPELTGENPGDDNDVEEPTDLPEESFQADPDDRDGAGDTPDAPAQPEV